MFAEPEFVVHGSVHGSESVVPEALAGVRLNVRIRGSEPVVARVGEPVRLRYRADGTLFAEPLVRKVPIVVEASNVDAAQVRIDAAEVRVEAMSPLSILAWIVSALGGFGAVFFACVRHVARTGGLEAAEALEFSGEVAGDGGETLTEELVTERHVSTAGAMLPIALGLLLSGCASFAECVNTVFDPQREQLKVSHRWLDAAPRGVSFDSNRVWIQVEDLSRESALAGELRGLLRSALAGWDVQITSEKADADLGILLTLRSVSRDPDRSRGSDLAATAGAVYGQHAACELSPVIQSRIASRARETDQGWQFDSEADSPGLFAPTQYAAIVDLAVIHGANQESTVFDPSGSELVGFDFAREFYDSGDQLLVPKTHQVALHRLALWCERARLDKRAATVALLQELKNVLAELANELLARRSEADG